MEFEDNVSLILKHFSLTEKQKDSFEKLGLLYHEWNQKINLISRKDIEHLYLHHILHSLSISKLITFHDGTKIMDVGTGGGLPGIPLAIMFPNCSFLLVDSIGKKIRVVQEIINSLGLDNTLAVNDRAENLDEQVDFVTGRAVSSLNDFYPRVQHLISVTSTTFSNHSQHHASAAEHSRSSHSQKNADTLSNGLIYLAGGDVETNLGKLKSKSTVYPIYKWFEEEYFAEKKIVYVRR